MPTYKNYNIQIKGRVHDTGFRNLVENIARSLNLTGMVYNDIDGTVKIVCGGTLTSIKSMVKELKEKCINVGASIDEIDQEEIHGRVYFPPYFFKAPTDELSDIGRKLDLGVQSMQNVEMNTGALVERTDSLLEKTDLQLEKTDSQLEKTDSLLEKTDLQLEKTDSLLEKTDLQLEKTDSLLEKTDLQLEKTDSLLEKTDALVEGQCALVEGQDKLVKGQDMMVDGQNKMIKILQKISEK